MMYFLPLRVAQVLHSFYPYTTGPANHCFNIAKRILGFDFECEVFTSDFNAIGSPPRELMESVTVNRFEITHRFMMYMMTPDLVKSLKEYNPDLIHCHGFRNYQVESSIRYAVRMKKPIVMSMHGTAKAYSFMVGSLIGRLPYVSYDVLQGYRLIKNLDRIIVNSSSEQRELAEFLKEDSSCEKIMKIPAGFDKRFDSARITHEGLVILSVARITKDRDPRILIHAFQRFEKEFPDATLRIVGPEARSSMAVEQGILNKCKDLVQQLRLEKKIIFLGELMGKELENEYRAADIFVYNSNYENFGQTIIDAASFGLPIIVTNVGVANDLISNGDDGYIVNLSDRVEDGFAFYLRKLLADATLRKSFGMKIKEKCLQEYDWDNIIQQYRILYEKIILHRN